MLALSAKSNTPGVRIELEPPIRHRGLFSHSVFGNRQLFAQCLFLFQLIQTSEILIELIMAFCVSLLSTRAHSVEFDSFYLLLPITCKPDRAACGKDGF